MDGSHEAHAYPQARGFPPGSSDEYDSPLTTPSNDGRIARRERNRERLVDAYVQLLRQGVSHPTASELAERTDLTPRTIYRHLRDDLGSDVGRRIVSSFRFLAPTESWKSASLSERVSAYVTFRCELHGETEALVRNIRANPATGDVVGDAVQVARSLVREELDSLFEAELVGLSDDDRHATVTTVHTLFLFDALDYLHQHLDPPAVHQVLCRHLRASLCAIHRQEREFR